MLPNACPKPRPTVKPPKGVNKVNKARKKLDDVRVYGSKGLKKRNRRRYSANWKRAYESVERVNFVAGLTCVGCGYGRNCENHHIKSGGKSRKADSRFVVPLCMPCHDEYHNLGRRSFETKYGINLDELAEETERAWRETGAACLAAF
jgi:hypothetical protein